MLFFSFSKKYRPFEHLKCHECLWCEFFDDCKKEHDYMLRLDAVADSFHGGVTHAKHEEIVIGEPIESLDINSIYPEWMKTHKDNVYGKSMKCPDWLCFNSEICIQKCGKDCPIYHTQKCINCILFNSCYPK